jgi:hypothetical protein
MQRRVSLFPVLLAAIALGVPFRDASAQHNHTPPPIHLTYRGGPLVQNARIVTLFWGPNWSQSPLPGYFDDFFRTLFADGRFMANLAQYSVNNYQIGSGSFAGTLTDSQQPPARLQDALIQAEIRAQAAAGHLPKPDPNTIYFVFTPPGVEVFDRYGDNSVRDFYSYHDYASGSNGFPYAVVAYDDSLDDPGQMTIYASHELAEAITDPAPTESQLGWYDDYYGEVVDIIDVLYDEGLIDEGGDVAELTGAGGSVYWVEKFWSLKTNAPVAF